MIPDEAVEAAARAIASASLRSKAWATMDDEERNHFSRDARAALEAAAPHLMAPIVALMEDPEHYDSQGPSEGYVSVENLRIAMGDDE